MDQIRKLGGLPGNHDLFFYLLFIHSFRSFEDHEPHMVRLRPIITIVLKGKSIRQCISPLIYSFFKISLSISLSLSIHNKEKRKCT